MTGREQTSTTIMKPAGDKSVLVLVTLDGIKVRRYPDGGQVGSDSYHPLSPCYVSTPERNAMHPARFACQIREQRLADLKVTT